MRVLVLLPTIVLAVAAGSAQAGSAGALHGVVRRGPVTPSCTAEQPCEVPAKGVTLVFSRNGTTVGRAVTDAAGRYRVRLPAGVYGVRRGSVTGIDRRLEPNHVRVPFGGLRLDFSIDTGIR